jgi:hypothetical protein
MKYLRHIEIPIIILLILLKDFHEMNIYIYIKTGNEPHILCKDEDMLT